MKQKLNGKCIFGVFYALLCDSFILYALGTFVWCLSDGLVETFRLYLMSHLSALTITMHLNGVG